MEVEDKKHIRPVKHDDLVLLVLGADKGLWRGEGVEREKGRGKLMKYSFMHSHYIRRLGFRGLQ